MNIVELNQNEVCTVTGANVSFASIGNYAGTSLGLFAGVSICAAMLPNQATLSANIVVPAVGAGGFVAGPVIVGGVAVNAGTSVGINMPISRTSKLACAAIIVATTTAGSNFGHSAGAYIDQLLA
jgi:hypothetical protein